MVIERDMDMARPVAVYSSRSFVRVLLSAFLLAGLLVTLVPAVSRAASFTVTNTGDSGPGSLRQAVQDASGLSGDHTITFALNNCPCTIVLTSVLIISGNITIQGLGADMLTISGGNTTQIIAIPPAVTATLDKLTISDGYTATGLGGGILVAGKLTILHSSISDNKAYSGGGIYNTGTLSIANSTFSANTASNTGGAVLNGSGPLTITNSTFIDNQAGSGGAIYANSGRLTVSDCSFIENRAVAAPETPGGYGDGGAIYTYRTTIEIDATEFIGNTAVAGGAAAFRSGTTITGISNSTFANNHVTNDGGAIYADEPLVIVNSTFSANKAGSLAGAVMAWATSNEGDSTIVASTFWGNTAPNGGSSIAPNGKVTISGLILADQGGSSCMVYASDQIIDGGYNLSSDATCISAETSVVTTDPLLLGPLADNGGLTQTHALLPGSPALDRIPLGTLGCGTTLMTDQRGVARPKDAGCDIGAFESPDSTLPVIAPTIDGTLGSNGWYTSDVTVSWSVVDDQTGISDSSGCDAATITTDTTGTTLTCEATSLGGTSRESVTIKRDATAPLVTVIGVTDGATYSFGAVPDASCITADATSGVASSAMLSRSGGPLGTVIATCDGAVDYAGNSGSSSVTYAATDSTPPTITPTVNGTLSTNGWYTSDVVVTWSVVDDESAISDADGCDTTTISEDTAGTTLTCEGTSAGGTASQSVTIKRDATKPFVMVTGFTDGAVYTVGDSMPSVGCLTIDPTSGVATAAELSITGGTVGDITVTCAGAIDNAGNSSLPVSATYTVHYDWQGFVPATDSRRGPRKLLAGPPLTVVFVINGGVGLDAVESITSIACNAAPGTEPTIALPVGRKGELQQGAANTFIFQWKTSRAMAGTCQVLRVTLTDGTSHDITYHFL